MLTLLDNAGTYELPTGWHEVSTKQFCDTDPLRTVEARASYFAGRPIQVNGMVADVLAWMLTPPPTDGANRLNLEELAYEQLEMIRAALARFPLHTCLPIVWGLYAAKWASLNGDVFRKQRADVLATSVMNECILFCYGDVMHCLSELDRLTNPETGVYRELSEPDTTEAGQRARAAGADELFSNFGYENVIKAVAPQLQMQESQVRQLPWGEVTRHLVFQRLTAILADTIQRNAQRAND